MATPQPRPVLPGCVASTAAAMTANGAPDAGIDYAELNRLLTSAERGQRLRELPSIMSALEQRDSAEAGAASAHLRLALAESQSASGLFEQAQTTLRAFPLDDPRAPDALLLLAEVESREGHGEASIRWLRQLAILFPDDERAVKALLRAAALSTQKPAALALLQDASDHADTGLAQAREWAARSHTPGFLDAADTRKLPPGLWRLAHVTLTDPAFAAVDGRQEEARRLLQCLALQQEHRFRLMRENPVLLADLADTVAALEVRLSAARKDLAMQESVFQETARSLKICRSGNQDCHALQTQRDAQGRALTGWRNRIRVLESKRDFLRDEQKALPARWQQDHIDNAGLALLLTASRSESRAMMQTLLQKSLADALVQWESLAALAHYRLALAQDPRLQNH